MVNPWIQLTDALLADKVSRGDVDAFAAVYDRYSPALLRHLLYRTPSREVAEDLLSKTFLKTWEYVHSGKKITYLKQFLYATAQNALVDHYRRKDANDVVSDDMEEYDRPDERDHAAVFVDRELDKTELDSHLSKIKPEFRDILVMKYIDELEIKEIAKMINATPNAIYVRVHRALKALKEQIGNQNELPPRKIS